MQLNQIRELKARSEDGRCLESTQVQKIQREPAIRAALRRLEEGYVFLMEEPTAEKEPKKAAAQAEEGKGSSVKRPRVDFDAVHRSATFEESDVASSAQPRRKRLKAATNHVKAAAAGLKAGKKLAAAGDPPAPSGLMSHFAAFKSLY